MINIIYELFLAELKFFEEHSDFAINAMKNPDECGELVELAIRKFLKEIIGERFKVTHGYIYSSQNKKLSPQIDIIITDKLVPHSFKRFEYLDNLEIVPAEAVVAIFEVKRTLRTSSLKTAREHLEKIFQEVPLSKDRSERYLPGGIELKVPIMGGKYSNPLIGIIGLIHEDDAWKKQALPWMVDVIFSFQGFLKAPKGNNGETFKVCSQRTQQEKFEYEEISDRSCDGRVRLLKGFVGYLLQYLNEVAGRTFDVNNYFA